MAGGGGIGGPGSSTGGTTLAGSGASNPGTGGSMQGAMGMGSNIDWTFGQGKVDEDKKQNVMKLLLALIGMPRHVTTGQSPGPANPAANQIWDPAQVGRLLQFGGGRR